jgi:serine protease inhibitor
MNVSIEFKAVILFYILRLSNIFEFFFQGSEAAAATAVIMMKNSCSINPRSVPIEFRVDRPFLFMIQEYHQNITLFSGRFLSPPKG